VTQSGACKNHCETPVNLRWVKIRGDGSRVSEYRSTRGRGNVLEQAGVKMANAKFPSFRSRDAKEGK